MLGDPCDPCDVIHDAKEVPVGIKIYARIHHCRLKLNLTIEIWIAELNSSYLISVFTWRIISLDTLTSRDDVKHAWRHDVITWNKNVKHWQDSYESYSIAFLDLENPEIDTNIVVLQYPQPEIEYMTWSMTSSRDAKMSSVESTVLKVIPLNFSTSKTLKTIPIKLLYDFYNPRYNTWHFDVMYDVITWRQSVKRWSYSLGNDSIEFHDLKNL